MELVSSKYYLLTYFDDELDWRTALSDCLGCPHPTPGWGGSLQLGSDYFTFADKLEATLRGCVASAAGRCERRRSRPP